MAKKFLVLLSGGQKSAYLAYWLVKRGHDVECLHFLAGANINTREHESAAAWASDLGVKLHTLDLTAIYQTSPPANRASLFAFTKSGDRESWLLVSLMLTKASDFALNHKFGVIVVGFLPNQHRVVGDRFLSEWNDWFSEQVGDCPFEIAVGISKPKLRIVAPFRTWDLADDQDDLEVYSGLEKITWNCLMVNAGSPCGQCANCKARTSPRHEIMVEAV